ncbi:lysostaphin resistance A-like protein [Roseateles sp. L2-2]|uniref:CPBP family intramembrane glutamic endopeptidase n=1 Tax=Roseateles sp. L2-2 TaxID=3422597 RepID=UPI003D35F714
MTVDAVSPAVQERWYRPSLRSPLVRIVLGAVATVAPVALSMAAIHAVLPKPYRQLWPQLLAAVLCLLAYRAFTRLVEKRQAPTELAPAPAARELLTGALLGLILITGIVGVLWSAGVLRITGATWQSLLGPMAEMTLAAVLEELLFRGVLLRVLLGRLGVGPAMAISSLLFGLGHLPTEGFSAVAFLAIMVAGALLSAAYLVHGRLWLPIGLHFGWNFATTALFGLSSSGNKTLGVLHTVLSGPAWLTGGPFGVEASTVTLAVTAAATVGLLVWRSGRPVAPALRIAGWKQA